MASRAETLQLLMNQKIERNEDGRSRVVIECVQPQVDCGEFPIKRVVGDTVAVEADVFTDGHDAIAAALQYRFEGDENWSQVAMQPLGNDRWGAEFQVDRLGTYRYTIVGWIDHFTTWRGYLSEAKAGGFLPQERGQLRTLLAAYLLEKALYEVRYELNNRPGWVTIPLEGILHLCSDFPERATEPQPARRNDKTFK